MSDPVTNPSTASSAVRRARSFVGPIVFVLGALAIGTALHELRREVAPPFPGEQKRIERLLERADRLEVLAVGNSHGSAIHDESVGAPTYGMWLLAQDVFEIESQLHWLLPQLPAVDTLLFTVSIGSFHHDNAACDAPERAMVRRLFYAQPPGYPMIPGDFSNYFQGRMTAALVRPDHWEPVWLALEKNMGLGSEPSGAEAAASPAGDDELAPRIVAPREEAKVQTAESLAIDANENVLPRHRSFEASILANNPDVEDDAHRAIERIIALAEARGIRIIFYTPPYSPPYVAGTDAEQRENTLAHMRRLVADHGVEYHDFSQDEAIVTDPTNFVNCDHLNGQGARKFTRLRIRPLVAAP